MKDKPESRTAVLRLKLGACLTAPTKRMAADLHAAAGLFNRARNRMVRFWERWCEDNPEAFEGNGSKMKIKLPKGFSTQLYHAGREAAPLLNSAIVASASNSILPAHILKKTPWNHSGTARRMWQAILFNEAARPCFRETGVGTPNSTTKLVIGSSGATLTFALWSKLSGRRQCSVTCRIGTRKLPRGLWKIIHKTAAGLDGWKLCDSELVWKEDKRRRGRGVWFWHMCYQRPPQNLGLSPTSIAKLTLLDGKADKPFEIASAVNFPWKIGDVNVLTAAYNRLEQRRLAIRNKYKNAGGGKKGHGRSRIEYSIRPMTRAMTAIQQRFSKRVVSEVIRYCQRYDCGTVMFDRPGMKQKMSGWFAAKDAPFDWTQFIARLEYRCWLFGIRLAASGEDVDGTPGDARVPQPVGSTGDALTTAEKPTKLHKRNGRRSRKAG